MTRFFKSTRTKSVSGTVGRIRYARSRSNGSAVGAQGTKLNVSANLCLSMTDEQAPVFQKSMRSSEASVATKSPLDDKKDFQSAMQSPAS